MTAPSGKAADATEPGTRWETPIGIGLPPVPPKELDPYLDAAAGCFVRFGIRKTSVQDIAAAMDLNRTTVYRQVGNVDSILRLLMAREVHGQLGEAFDRTKVQALDPPGLVRLLAEMIRIVRGHPIVAKILQDEPELQRQSGKLAARRHSVRSTICIRYT